MEYCETDLFCEWLRRLESKTGFRLTEVVSVLSGVAAGIAYLHGMGVLHRDLKMENVLLRLEGHAVGAAIRYVTLCSVCLCSACFSAAPLPFRSFPSFVS